MTQIDLFTGFLGAGKTTLLNKLLPVLQGRGETLAIIENDFGETPVDSQVLSGHGLPVTELSAGCICCSLVGELIQMLRRLVEEHRPGRILIEPSGISRTSDILRSVEHLERQGLARRGRIINVVDCGNFAGYREDFGPFFTDQIQRAACNLLSHVDGAIDLPRVIDEITALNDEGICFAGDWLGMDAELLYDVIDQAPRPPSLPGQDDHDHHHHVAAVFASWSVAPKGPVTEAALEQCLQQLSGGAYGTVLRAKGIAACGEGGCLRFDFLPGHLQINKAPGTMTPTATVIGQNLDHQKLEELFGRLAQQP